MDYKGTSKLDEAISKYGGGDAQYELELKKRIREGMGYSNFLSKRNALQGKDVDLPDVEGMTPAGIKSMVGGAIGMQEAEMGSLDKILGGVDSAAGSLASSLAAKSRAGGSGSGVEDLASVQPKNWVQSEVLAYAKNPYNQDGTLKTRDQLKTELEGQFIGEGGVNDIQGVTLETVGQTIDALIPQDFEQNANTYQYRAMGYTKAEAEDLRAYDRYVKGSMSNTEKDVYELKNPTWAKKATLLKENQGLIDDIGMKIDENGKATNVPKYSYSELKKNYPNMPEAELKELVGPLERQAAKDDIRSWVGERQEELYKTYDEEGIYGVQEADSYKKLRKDIEMEYGEVISTQGDIDRLIYDVIKSFRQNSQSQQGQSTRGVW